VGCSLSQLNCSRVIDDAVPRDSDNTGGQLFDTQTLALVDLYWSTNGPSWAPGAAAGWDVYNDPAASPVCESTWARIACDGGDVV
jgi:hypothetical protein